MSATREDVLVQLVRNGIPREKILSISIRAGSVIVEVIYADSVAFDMAYSTGITNKVVLHMDGNLISNCAVCNNTLGTCDVFDVAYCSQSKLALICSVAFTPD
jgi:hypothetical protein